MFNCNCDLVCGCDYDVCCDSDCESLCFDCYEQANKDWECDGECEYGECLCNENTRHTCSDCFGSNWDHCDYCSAKKRTLIEVSRAGPPGHVSQIRNMFRLNKPLKEIEQKVASESEKKHKKKRPASAELASPVPVKKKLKIVLVDDDDDESNDDEGDVVFSPRLNALSRNSMEEVRY